jgi:rhodanese-related sulfurtransferase
VLKNARLVESERHGTSVTYRLAAPSVTALWLALRGVAEERLPQVSSMRRDAAGVAASAAVPRAELLPLLKKGGAVVIDVRPAVEFQHGHVKGAISIPLEELGRRASELPRDRRIVAYCRGEYCLLADEAVALLRRQGFDAVRLEGGWPEWQCEGRLVARG